MVAPIRAVRGLLFDLDGTLVDTETQTDLTIEAVAARHGASGFALPQVETRGRTWMHVAERIIALTDIDTTAAALSAEMLEHWNAGITEVKPIPGAPDAIQAAAARGLRLAVVSSSPRAVIDRLLEKLGVAPLVGPDARVGGDDVRIGKPDPEGFLMAARALGIEPGDALVFEDSRAGLLAAQAAGMRSMYITCCAGNVAENAPLATAMTTHYRALPAAFWDQLVSASVDFAGNTYS
jgi:mannitol-1-/sugar-/sorbitol-6-phosphatase